MQADRQSSGLSHGKLWKLFFPGVNVQVFFNFLSQKNARRFLNATDFVLLLTVRNCDIPMCFSVFRRVYRQSNMSSERCLCAERAKSSHAVSVLTPAQQINISSASWQRPSRSLSSYDTSDRSCPVQSLNYYISAVGGIITKWKWSGSTFPIPNCCEISETICSLSTSVLLIALWASLQHVPTIISIFSVCIYVVTYIEKLGHNCI